jgi:cobalamin biosynthesis protein CobT
MNQEYKNRYLKYKLKYLDLKKELEGGLPKLSALKTLSSKATKLSSKAKKLSSKSTSTKSGDKRLKKLFKDKKSSKSSKKKELSDEKKAEIEKNKNLSSEEKKKLREQRKTGKKQKKEDSKKRKSDKSTSSKSSNDKEEKIQNDDENIDDNSDITTDTKVSKSKNLLKSLLDTASQHNERITYEESLRQLFRIVYDIKEVDSRVFASDRVLRQFLYENVKLVNLLTSIIFGSNNKFLKSMQKF